MVSSADQASHVAAQSSGAAPSQATPQAHAASQLPVFARPQESDSVDAIQSTSSLTLHTSATIAVSSIAMLATMQGAQGEPGNHTAQNDKENSPGSTVEIGSSEPPAANVPSNPTSQKSVGSNIEALTAAIRSNLGTLQQTGHVSIRLDLNPPELGPMHIQVVAHNQQISLKDEAARQAVAGQVEALRHSLADAGVTLGHVNLRHEGDGARPEQQSYSDEQPQQNASTKNLNVRKSSSADSKRGGIDLIA